jgi:DNA-binding CsgD family transcriptional regulator
MPTLLNRETERAVLDDLLADLRSGRGRAAEPVGLIFAAREPGEQFRGLADLEVRGLPDQEARALLRSAVRFRLDERVQDRILAEANGNPLALLELPHGLDPARLAGGFGLVGARAVPARILEVFRRRLAALPADTQSPLLVAAAEPAGDPVLVWRAADRLGIPASAAEAAKADGLLQIRTRVRFRHPLVRSAVYSTASPEERRSAHLALAEITDRDRDSDRRAWHLAAAAQGPDEQVAAELERSAGRAQARGGMAAAAAFLRRAAELLSDGADAERCYREAVDRLGRTGFRPELARAHLLYGEWLRREDRRADARTQLRAAHDMFTAIGMEAFAERARRELRATGETVRTRTADPRDQLTPQEAQIARLARAGLSNPEIATQLFLSPRTVEYHLAKVFTKLDITSRRQLRRAVPDGGRDGPMA